MFGFFGAIGPLASKISESRIGSIWQTGDTGRFFAPTPTVSVSLFVPAGHSIDTFTAMSSDESIMLGVTGYILTDKPLQGLDRHIQFAADLISQSGFEQTVRKLAGGCFAVFSCDSHRNEFSIAVDPVGTIPVYYVQLDGSWLFSNNPTALCRSGLFRPELDSVGVAEWAFFSYALGNRYPIRQIRTLRMGEYFRWNGEVGAIESYDRLWDRLPFDQTPPVEDIAAEIKAACTRLSRIDNRPAQLQSSGFDSRLLTASWPDGSPLHCFTYGNPRAHEISIAKCIAEQRGADWTQTWQHGDELADVLDDIFDASGIIIWPDHYFVASRQTETGYMGTLNGLGGDPLIGDTYLNYNHYLGQNMAAHRILCRFYDLSAAEIGNDAIAEALFRAISQIPSVEALRDFVSDEFIDTFRKVRADILQDIHRELKYVKPESDSLALLWRNFLYANRIPNMVSQQMIMLLQYELVYCPITNDAAFHDIAFRLPAKDIAYYRLYRRLYLRCFPDYAAIPYGDTLIPIKRPLWNHKIAAIMLNKGIYLPLLTNPANGRPRDPNSWALWMRESSRLREYIEETLCISNVADKHRLTAYLSDITSGKRLGGGKIFHVLSIAKWQSFCQ